jgi:hypothetical protein
MALKPPSKVGSSTERLAGALISPGSSRASRNRSSDLIFARTKVAKDDLLERSLPQRLIFGSKYRSSLELRSWFEAAEKSSWDRA